MFDRFVLHGQAASILWGYRPAVQFKTWRIAKQQQQFVLTGTTARVDVFGSRQKPLLFTYPMVKTGFAVWPIVGEVQIRGNQLVATLGPPEQ